METKGESKKHPERTQALQDVLEGKVGKKDKEDKEPSQKGERQPRLNEEERHNS
jgi:hypothetical protein